MNIISIIETKKNKKPLSEEEIKFFIDGLVNKKNITDYQATALLMAIYLNGLNSDETYYLTKWMLNSGNRLSFNNINGFIIDKHSTGGVGDKVSLIIAPLCAALGINVAKLSGRGLSYTGGTIDKMESIGIDCSFNNKSIPLFKKTKILISSQTDDIVPADKIIYALRNDTSTVNSEPLIAASIASKKLALKTNHIFIDLKVGDGSFCKTINQAISLANTLKRIFNRFKRRFTIHITSMVQPLGRAIGNAIEVKEAINFLKGKFETSKLKDLIYDFLIDILMTSKIAINKKNAIELIDSVIKNKKAYNCFIDWAVTNGSDKNKLKSFTYFKPRYSLKIISPSSGYISYTSTKKMGMLSNDLGAGRLKKNSKIDWQAGIYLNKIYNEKVKKGEVIATLYSSKPISSIIKTQFIKNVKIKNTKFNDYKQILKVVK